MKCYPLAKIDDMLDKLPSGYLKEVEDFIAFLLEKEKRRKTFEDKIIKASKEPRESFTSTDELMRAIDAAD